MTESVANVPEYIPEEKNAPERIPEDENAPQKIKENDPDDNEGAIQRQTVLESRGYVLGKTIGVGCYAMVKVQMVDMLEFLKKK